jgi:hypothetical protein
MDTMRGSLSVATIAALMSIAGCGGQAPQGGVRQSCYPNGTCNLGLTCLSMVCVDDTGAGGAGGKSGAAGTSGAAGKSGAAGTSGAAGSGGAGAGGASGAGTGSAGSGGSPALRIISVDFVGGRPGAMSVPMSADEIAGAKPASNWNSAPGGMGTLAPLVFSDGVASGASLAWSPPMEVGDTGTWTVGYTDMPGDVRMMNGFLGPPSAAIPAAGVTLLTVSDLPASMASGSYDVYVYVLGSPSAMRTYQYAIGNTAFTVVQDMGMGTPPQPATPYPYVLAPDGGMGNHIIFRGVTGSSFALTVKPAAGATRAAPRAPVNGLQIVSPSGS